MHARRKTIGDEREACAWGVGVSRKSKTLIGRGGDKVSIGKAKEEAPWGYSGKGGEELGERECRHSLPSVVVVVVVVVRPFPVYRAPVLEEVRRNRGVMYGRVGGRREETGMRSV